MPRRSPAPTNGHLTEADATITVLQTELREERTASVENTRLLQEQLAALELALEDAGWLRLDAQSNEEFSRPGLDRIVRLARLMYLKNPLINRLVDVQALYVWGQGVNVKADDTAVNERLQAFLTDPGNKAEITSHQAQRLKEVELQVAGNVFLVLFPNKTDGTLRVRSVPIEEVQEIVCNPEDRNDVWYYRRTWMQTDAEGQNPKSQEAFYPDWRYQPATRPGTLRDKPIQWNSPIYHVKVGGFPHWRFGVPEVYAALDWARAYKDALEDDATRSKALARFVWNLTTPGGKRAVQAAKTKLGTTYAADGTLRETNPAPNVASTSIMADGVELKAHNISQAVMPTDHARPMRLMVAAAAGLPETFFGDADVGNHATSKTLDRPTELKFHERQELWKAVLADLCDLVARGPQTRGELTVTDQAAPHVDVDFPDLLERSATERIGAVVAAATLGGHPSADTLTPEMLSRLLMQALGVDDLDEELKALAKQQAEKQAQVAAQPVVPVVPAQPGVLPAAAGVAGQGAA